MCVCVREEIYSRTYWSSYEYYLQNPVQLLSDRTNKSFFRLSLIFSKPSSAGQSREFVLTFPQLHFFESCDYETITVSQIVAYVILIFILGKLWVSSRKKEEWTFHIRTCTWREFEVTEQVGPIAKKKQKNISAEAQKKVAQNRIEFHFTFFAQYFGKLYQTYLKYCLIVLNKISYIFNVCWLQVWQKQKLILI